LIDEAIDLSDDLGHFETVVNRDEDGPAFGGIASSRLVYGFAELEIGNNSPEYAAATDNEAESSDRIKFWVGHEDLFWIELIVEKPENTRSERILTQVMWEYKLLFPWVEGEIIHIAVGQQGLSDGIESGGGGGGYVAGGVGSFNNGFETTADAGIGDGHGWVEINTDGCIE
jgi:hypothetical protein